MQDFCVALPGGILPVPVPVPVPVPTAAVVVRNGPGGPPGTFHVGDCSPAVDRACAQFWPSPLSPVCIAPVPASPMPATPYKSMILSTSPDSRGPAKNYGQPAQLPQQPAAAQQAAPEASFIQEPPFSQEADRSPTPNSFDGARGFLTPRQRWCSDDEAGFEIATPTRQDSQVTSRSRSLSPGERSPERVKMGPGIVVRNTFLDSKPERSPSLERFLMERRCQSSPCSRPGSASPRSRLELASPQPLAEPRMSTPRMRHSPGPPAFNDKPAVAAEALEAAAVEAEIELAAASAASRLAEELASTVLDGPITDIGGFDRQAERLVLGYRTPMGAGSAVGSASVSGSAAAAPPSGKQLPWGYAGSIGSTCSGEVQTASVNISDTGQAGSADAGDASSRAQPGVGSLELPSRGSVLHRWGACRPCAFVFQGGCQNALDCQFCHLCEPGEKKRRKKERQTFKRDTKTMQQAVAREWTALAQGPHVLAAPVGPVAQMGWGYTMVPPVMDMGGR